MFSVGLGSRGLQIRTGRRTSLDSDGLGTITELRVFSAGLGSRGLGTSTGIRASLGSGGIRVVRALPDLPGNALGSSDSPV